MSIEGYFDYSDELQAAIKGDPKESVPEATSTHQVSERVRDRRIARAQYLATVAVAVEVAELRRLLARSAT